MSTLRVTAGALRGRRIPLPSGDLRPTSERARQAFFNILGDRLQGARFLDLFAGSGIFAFEAVSRGAASATAVDHDRRKVEAVARRANEWNAPITAITGEAVTTLPRFSGTEFDIVFADPPYDYTAYGDLLAAIDRHLALGAEAVVAIEHRRRTDPFRGHTGRLRLVRRAEYGEVWISFFEHDAGLA